MDLKQEEVPAATYKIVLIGDSGVGKSNLIWRYANNEFTADSKATLGVEFALKTVKASNQTITAQLWDTAGQERYRSITKAYYKEALAAIVVYDITKRSTFINVEKWLRELRDHAECDMVLGLFGNKCDLKQTRVIKVEEGVKLAEDNKMLFFETSALNATNVNKAFQRIIEGLFIGNILEIESKKRENEYGKKNGMRLEDAGLYEDKMVTRLDGCCCNQ